MKGKYLITTDDWFIAPDGKSYRAVWGNVGIIEDTFLGIKTNRNSANWYAKIGNDKNHVIIAGCQIHYAVKCDYKPNTEEVTSYTIGGNDGITRFIKPSDIYVTE